MDEELRKALRRIDQSIKAFQRALDEERVEVTPLTNQKVMFMCPNCEGAFQPHERGLKCSHCGHIIDVKWPDGSVPSAAALRHFYRLSQDGGDLFSEDSSDKDAA